VGAAMMVAVGLWSMIQTLRKDGIRWRGTYYPLEQLIAGQRVKL
jgi:hydrogenase/urease accessory protein HupE